LSLDIIIIRKYVDFLKKRIFKLSVSALMQDERYRFSTTYGFKVVIIDLEHAAVFYPVKLLPLKYSLRFAFYSAILHYLILHLYFNSRSTHYCVKPAVEPAT